jgi:hypothetical protein
MIMILNDVLTRQNVFTKIVLKDGDKELSKELKVKVMRIRMAYTKVKKAFDAEVQEFTEELMTDEFKELNSKQDRTSEEEARYTELSNAINSDYQEFLIQKGKEEVVLGVEDTFTIDEYGDILEVNAGNDVEINGNKIPAVDFLEIVYDLFVKED